MCYESVSPAGKCEDAKKKLPSLLPWHHLCRSLSGRPVTILWLFYCSYNGFCPRLPGEEIIFFSCLARLQLRNKLLMEGRGRFLIMVASHTVDLSPALLSSVPIAQLQWQEKRKQSLTKRTYNLSHLSKSPGIEWQGPGFMQLIPISNRSKTWCLLIIYVCQFQHLVALRWDSRPSVLGSVRTGFGSFKKESGFLFFDPKDWSFHEPQF